MPLVTTHYRPKRASRKKQPTIANRIVTPAKLKPDRRPAIRLEAQVPKRTEFPPAEPQPKRPVIIEPKRKRSHLVAMLDDITPEELQQRGDAADALFRELVRRAAENEH